MEITLQTFSKLLQIKVDGLKMFLYLAHFPFNDNDGHNNLNLLKLEETHFFFNEIL